MGKFKPLKELVRALTYIGDAIAGTNKSSNSESGSNDFYDGILQVTNGFDIIYFSFGIKDNDNATKIGDLFTDNFINDFNNYWMNDVNDNEDYYYFISIVDNLDNIVITGPNDNPHYNDGSVECYYNTGILKIYMYNDIGETKFAYKAILSDKLLTKDTPLEKLNPDDY